MNLCSVTLVSRKSISWKEDFILYHEPISCDFCKNRCSHDLWDKRIAPYDIFWSWKIWNIKRIIIPSIYQQKSSILYFVFCTLYLSKCFPHCKPIRLTNPGTIYHGITDNPDAISEFSFFLELKNFLISNFATTRIHLF